MNKLKFAFLSLAVVLGLGSCNKNDYEYDAAEQMQNAQVAFPLSTASTINLTKSDSIYNMVMTRQKTDGALNVPLQVTGDTSCVKIPSVVTFPDGKDTVLVPVTMPFDSVGYDNPKKVTLTIADASYTTPYGFSTLDLTVQYPAPWTSIGTGQFKEDFMDGTGEYYDVEIQQNDLDPTLFRVVEPYHAVAAGGGEYEPTADISEYFQMEIVKGMYSYDFVYFPDVNTGYHHASYDADIYAVNPYRFTSLQTESDCQYNKVVDWQENGLPGEIELAPYYYMFGVGGWNYTQKEGTIDIIFPGYVKQDMSADVHYLGIFTATDGSSSACANLTLGADAKDVRAVVMPQEADADAVASSIAAGETDAYAVEAGEIKVPFNYEELGSNKLQIIVAVLQNDTIVRTVASCNFEYYGGAETPWKSLGYGLYTDDAIITLFSQDEEGTPFDPITYTVEIQESTETPGLYRIMDPYAIGVYPYAEAFKNSGYTMPSQGTNYIEVNATDPEGVYIATQDLGMDLGDGAMGILTNAYRYMTNYDVETLKSYGYMGIVRNDSIMFPSFYKSSSDHSKGTYQGFLTEAGELAYYMGTNQQFTIVLPDGVTPAKKKAINRKLVVNAHKLAGLRFRKMMHDLAYKPQTGIKSRDLRLGFKRVKLNANCERVIK